MAKRNWEQKKKNSAKYISSKNFQIYGIIFKYLIGDYNEWHYIQ